MGLLEECLKKDTFRNSIENEKSDDKEIFDSETMCEYINKSKNATCEIFSDNESYGSGFFCKIPYTNNKNLFLNVLLTCEHVLNEKTIFSENSIKIKVNNIIKNLSLKYRKKWCNKKMDYSCIEIIEEDEIDDYYQLDDIILNKNYKN